MEDTDNSSQTNYSNTTDTPERDNHKNETQSRLLNEKLHLHENVVKDELDQLTTILILQAKTNRGISLGLLVVGGVTFLVGILKFTFSTISLTGISQGLIVCILGLIVISIGKLWREPADRLSKTISNQALIKVAYVGFLNRINQVKQFNLQPQQTLNNTDVLKQNEDILKDSIEQVCRFLSDHPLN
jgi:hypothetical protein